MKGLGGILVPGGFGERGIEGKIKAAQYARENKMPYLGLCLGMQIATIEFARNVLKLAKAHSTEFDPNTPHPVIAMLDEQTQSHQQRRHDAAGRAALPVGARHQGGGTLRLVCRSTNATATATNSTTPTARNLRRPALSSAACRPTASWWRSSNCQDHPFFMASQFHPEFQSKPHQPHPLFKGFIAAAHARLHQKPL